MYKSSGCLAIAFFLISCSGNEGVVPGEDAGDLTTAAALDGARPASLDMSMAADLSPTTDSSALRDAFIEPDYALATDALARPDLLAQHDLVAWPDFESPADLASSVDLALPDFAASLDFSTPTDVTAPSDLTRLPDLLTPPDFAVADMATGDMATPKNQIAFTSPPGSPYAVCAMPQPISVGDFNSDSHPDVAVTCINSNAIGVLLNNGDGSFGALTTYATDVWPIGLTVGDFNGDRILDVAVANLKPGVSPSTVSFLAGKANGTFAAAVNTTTYGTGAQSITSADFNLDGKLDLALIDTGTQDTVILPGTGQGTFGRALHNARTTGYDIATGDFNADNKPDLALINTGGQVLVMLGAGTGLFAAAVPYLVGMHGAALRVAADLNGDGIVDIAAALGLDQAVGVLLGNQTQGVADGTFKAAGPFNLPATSTGPRGITVADFNVDGMLDLATIDTAAGACTVFVGDGAGGFVPTLDFPVGNSPTGIASADFNGDGKPDIAAVNQGDGTISILLTK